MSKITPWIEAVTATGWLIEKVAQKVAKLRYDRDRKAMWKRLLEIGELETWVRPRASRVGLRGRGKSAWSSFRSSSRLLDSRATVDAQLTLAIQCFTIVTWNGWTLARDEAGKWMHKSKVLRRDVLVVQPSASSFGSNKVKEKILSSSFCAWIATFLSQTQARTSLIVCRKNTYSIREHKKPLRISRQESNSSPTAIDPQKLKDADEAVRGEKDRDTYREREQWCSAAKSISTYRFHLFRSSLFHRQPEAATQDQLNEVISISAPLDPRNT